MEGVPVPEKNPVQAAASRSFAATSLTSKGHNTRRFSKGLSSFSQRKYRNAEGFKRIKHTYAPKLK